MTHVVRWCRIVDEIAREDVSAARPSIQHITLVAHQRMLYADLNGLSCYPSQSTLARKCGMNRESVRAVDAWLADRGLIVLVRKRPGNVMEYRLVDPVEDQAVGTPQCQVDGTTKNPVGPLECQAVGTVEDQADSGWPPVGPRLASQRTTTDIPDNRFGLSSTQDQEGDQEAACLICLVPRCGVVHTGAELAAAARSQIRNRVPA